MKKIKLAFEQKPSPCGRFNITTLRHVKLMDEDGKYIRFQKQDSTLLKWLENQSYDIPDIIVDKAVDGDSLLRNRKGDE